MAAYNSVWNGGVSVSHDDFISTGSIGNVNLSAEEASLLKNLQNGISYSTMENVVFTKEITGLLSILNIDIKTLPKDIKEGLEKLSSIIKAEKLDEFDERALCINKLRRDIMKKKQQQQEKQMILTYAKLVRNSSKLQKKIDILQESICILRDSLNATERNNMDCNKIFLSNKLKEYQQTIEKLNVTLSDMDLNSSNNLLLKYKTYMEMKSESKDLDQMLDQYGDLPPNLPEAKLLLESKKKEYEALEQQFLENTH